MEDWLKKLEDFIHTDWVMTALSAVAIMAVTAVIAEVVTRAIRKVMAFNKQKDLPASSIFVNIARATIWVLGICIMLSTCFNVNVSAAIAALGVGGIAISLGAQDTLANLIGGLQLTLFQIVKPGDNITIGTSTGKITDITWRHTRLIDDDGDVIIVPNKMMNTTTLVKTEPATFIELSIMLTVTKNLDMVAEAIQDVALHEASKVGEVVAVPHLYFTHIIDDAVAATLEVKMKNQKDIMDATDLIVRAIAPLTRNEYALDESKTEIESLQSWMDQYRAAEKQAAEQAREKRRAAQRERSRSAEWKLLHKLRLTAGRDRRQQKPPSR